MPFSQTFRFFCWQRCYRTAILLVWKDIKLAFHWKAYLECSFWVMCNLLPVFIVQLRSHIWWGWYQLGILGSHASIMASVKLGNYIASVINPCDQYNPPPHTHTVPALIYEWQNLTRGQFRWVAAYHMIPALKSQARNVDRTPPPSPFLKKTLMPHITTNTLSIPSLLRPSYAQRCWGGERVPQWRVVVGVGTQIVAAFDLKVASPLLVLRDPWRTRLALI